MAIIQDFTFIGGTLYSFHRQEDHHDHLQTPEPAHQMTVGQFEKAFPDEEVGSFHKVSAKYIPLYVAEFQFRYNNGFNADIFATAIEGC
jgi:hypothetical protein